MSFSIESSLPAPTPVYGQRRKGARNGGRSGRNSAWPPRCGEEGSPEYSHDQGLWELRCEWDRLAGLDEVLSYLETQDTALGELEAAVTNGQGTDALAALHRRFREIAAETFNGVRLLGGNPEALLLGRQCPEAFDALEGGRFYLMGSAAGDAPVIDSTAEELFLADIARLRLENRALQSKVHSLRDEGGEAEGVDVCSAKESLIDARQFAFRDAGEALVAQAHAMNGAVLRLLD
jgi:hypothetical protein